MPPDAASIFLQKEQINEKTQYGMPTREVSPADENGIHLRRRSRVGQHNRALLRRGQLPLCRNGQRSFKDRWKENNHGRYRH